MGAMKVMINGVLVYLGPVYCDCGEQCVQLHMYDEKAPQSLRDHGVLCPQCDADTDGMAEYWEFYVPLTSPARPSP